MCICKGTTVHKYRSKDNFQEWVLSYFVGYKDQIQAVQLGSSAFNH